jgi:hypothetical protein
VRRSSRPRPDSSSAAPGPKERRDEFLRARGLPDNGAGDADEPVEDRDAADDAAADDEAGCDAADHVDAEEDSTNP